jgi:hypothetical protein
VFTGPIPNRVAQIEPALSGLHDHVMFVSGGLVPAS